MKKAQKKKTVQNQNYRDFGGIWETKNNVPCHILRIAVNLAVTQQFLHTKYFFFVNKTI